jgi:hypothetical protein
MLFLMLLSLMSAGYFLGTVWLHSAPPLVTEAPNAAMTSPLLPEDDQPPAGDLGWPADGSALQSYLDDGYAALDTYLSEDHSV